MSQWSIEVTQPIGEHASGEEAIESTSSRPKDLGAVQECAGSAIEKTSMSAWTTRKVRVSDVYEGTHA